jgi:hypothetical protein
MRFFIIFIVSISPFTVFGQGEGMVLSINPDSIQIIHSKQDITRKTFNSIQKMAGYGLNYDNIVNPGQEFNTTDIVDGSPRSRLVVGIKTDNTWIILFEWGSYYGVLTTCMVAVRNNNKYEIFETADKIKKEDELLGRIKAKDLVVRRAGKK